VAGSDRGSAVRAEAPAGVNADRRSRWLQTCALWATTPRMTFAAIEAQDGAVRVLTHALASGRLGQSYLFVGPSGVGKQLAALALARAANCPEQPGVGCDQCESCRRIDARVHPDVRVFEPRDEGHGNLPVDYLRNEVLPFAKFAPFEAKEAFLI